jgi:hypothetical protein
MESRIGGSAESSLAADFGVTYGSTVITGGQTGELDFEDVGRRARPGERAPHAWVDVHGKRLSTIDLFDGHLTLMIGAAGEAWRAAATMLPSGPPFQVLAVGTEISDPTGELVQRYGLAGTAAVLVRPDGYVSWSSQAAEHDIGETLRRAVTQSLGESVPAAARLVAVA